MFKKLRRRFGPYRFESDHLIFEKRGWLSKPAITLKAGQNLTNFKITGAFDFKMGSNSMISHGQFSDMEVGVKISDMANGLLPKGVE